MKIRVIAVDIPVDFAINAAPDFSQWLVRLLNAVCETGAPIVPKNGAP